MNTLEPSSLKTPLIIAAAILLILGGIFYLNVFNVSQLTDILPKDKPYGRIYLSLVPLEEGYLQRIYYYDFKTKGLHLLEGDFNAATSPLTNIITPVFSQDGRKIAFMGQAQDDTNTNEIYIMDADGSNIKQITNSPVAKRLPDWSPDGTRIAFEVTPENLSPEALVPENWEIHMSDLAGNEQLVTYGMFPKFSPDGTKLLVLKNTGLAIYDLTDPTFSTSELLIPIAEGSASGVMKLGLSADRSLLAWSFPNAEQIYIYRLNSWGTDTETSSADLITTIPSLSFWPVFSPDNTHIAVEEIETDYDHPVLVSYEIQTGARTRLFDLSEYYQEAMWVNEWR